jgi:hypothetical protein
MEPTPRVTSPETVQKRSGYQAVQPPERPSYWGVDLDPERRPGVPRMREPQPWPNTRYPPERQPGRPAVPKHNRPNKPFPPVFGTAVPLHGLSGAIRELAYRLPDHRPSHWLLLMLGDRVDSWGMRLRRVMPIALPIAALGLFVRLVRR